MRLLHARPDLFRGRLCAGRPRQRRCADSRMDERQSLPMRRLSKHRRRDQRSTRQDGNRVMNPFTYSRANDAQAAVTGVAANPKAKFLGGGTNLVDLMKMGVEQPEQLVDINRLDLAKVEELPNNG